MGADEAGPPKGPGRATTVRQGAGRRVKPPVTIDLEARPAEAVRPQTAGNAGENAPSSGQGEALHPETAAAASPAAERSKTEQAGSSERATKSPVTAALAGAGAAGGLVVLALGFGLQAAGMLPAPGRTAATEALDQRLTAIEAASAQTIADRALLDDLARRVGVADAFGTSLGDRILSAEASIAALGDGAAGAGGGVTSEMLDDIAGRVRRLEGSAPGIAGETISAAGVAALEQRIAAIEADRAEIETLGKRLDSLAADHAALASRLDARPPVLADNESAARAAVIGALRQAAAGGESFGADLAAIGALGIASKELAALAPLAEKGAPSRAELAAEFPAVADRILAARYAAGDDAGLVDRVLSYGRGLIRITPTGPLTGNNPPAVVSRMQAAVDADDLAAALAEREALPAVAQEASRQWAADVADRIAIDRLVEDLAMALGASEGSG